MIMITGDGVTGIGPKMYKNSKKVLVVTLVTQDVAWVVVTLVSELNN